MSDGAPRVPRSSPAHLVYKFGGAVQQVLDLVTQIDAKTLSDKQTQRVRKRIHDLDGALWPDEQHGDAGVVDFRITSAQAQKSAADGLREAQAKIEKLQADLASMQSQPAASILPVNQFRLTQQDTEHDFPYDLLFAEYARGSTSAVLSEPYVERSHQVTNVDAFLTSITRVEPRISDVTLITTPGKSEAVNSYLAQVVRTWTSRGVKLHVQYEQGAHARYINFSSGLRIRGDRCLDIYRRPQKKGMPRACLPTEIFVERVQNRSPQHAVQSAMVPVPMSRERKQAQTFPVKRSPVKKAPMMAPASTDNERKPALPSPVKRSPVKKSSPKKSSEDPSPVDIWRDRYRKKLAALLQNARDKNFFMDEDDDMDCQDPSVARERASMKREHAMALAREYYEDLHDGNGMKNEHIRRESQRVAIWDLHIQHLCGERYFGDMQKDGTILYTEPPHTVDDERIIRPADPYVFRVRDEYHQLFIDHYYDGEDYTSPESDGSAESDGSLEADDFSSE